MQVSDKGRSRRNLNILIMCTILYKCMHHLINTDACTYYSCEISMLIRYQNLLLLHSFSGVHIVNFTTFFDHVFSNQLSSAFIDWIIFRTLKILQTFLLFCPNILCNDSARDFKLSHADALYDKLSWWRFDGKNKLIYFSIEVQLNVYSMMNQFLANE